MVCDQGEWSHGSVLPGVNLPRRNSPFRPPQEPSGLWGVGIDIAFLGQPQHPPKDRSRFTSGASRF